MSIEPMPKFYSAESLRTIWSIQSRLGQLLRERALDSAARCGRDIVTEDDIWGVLTDVDLADLFADPGPR